jgi:hypothetical protein
LYSVIRRRSAVDAVVPLREFIESEELTVYAVVLMLNVLWTSCAIDTEKFDRRARKRGALKRV